MRPRDRMKTMANLARIAPIAAFGIALAVVFVFVNALTTQGTHPGNNVLGWAWGGSTDDNLGPANQDTATGFGWLSLDAPNINSVPCAGGLPQGCYGVKIPETTDPSNDVTGYAWSGNLGWVRLDAPPDTSTYKGPTYLPDPSPCRGYPTTPCYSVKRLGNELVGWARICSFALSSNCSGPPDANTGGWEGWIKFSSNNYDPGLNYGNGVTLVQNLAKDPDGGLYDITGYAWSPEFGWIGFGGLSANPPDPNPVVSFLVTAPPPPSPIVSCYGSPDPAYLSSKDVVTWTAIVSDPSDPSLTYSWSDPTPNGVDPPLSGNTPSIKVTYTTTGLKDAQVDITSDSGPASATCSITVKAFRVREIIPFF